MAATLSTPALVLHTHAYSETSVIAKVFTRQLGVRSYILKGVRRNGSRTKQNLLQPLSYVDMVVYNNPHRTLNYVKEMSPHPIPTSPTASMEQEATRNALRFFMTELLYKTLHEEEPMPKLFDEVVEGDVFSNLHLTHTPIAFLLQVSHHLGIEPLDNYSAREPHFDLNDGRFKYAERGNIDRKTSLLLHEYLQALHNGTPYPMATLPQRRLLINHLIDYYRYHIDDFHNFQSHEILHGVLTNTPA